MMLAPQQIVGVDLTALRQAAASRSDLDTVSVQIVNSGSPGSLIGAAYGKSRATQLTYDVPLRDYGKIRNTTGSYPWRIDDDYSTIVSITNMGNQPARFQVEIRYPGGPYSIKPRQLAIGETVTFDLRTMRDKHEPDRTGKTLPMGLDHGQFHWSLVATPGEAHIIGRAEVVSRTAHVASSYSCTVCCPDYGPSGGFAPNAYGLYIDGFAATGSNGQYIDCYSNTYPTSIWWTSLSTWDSSVATFASGTEDLQGEGAGFTYAVGTFDYIYYDNDGMDCYQRYYSPADYANVEVLSLTWTTPHSLNEQDGVVPLSSGSPPSGSPAFINSTTITATGSPSGGTYSWSTSSNKVTLTNTSSATVTVTSAAESQNTRDITITVTYTDNGQSISSQIPFTVQKPTFMDYVSIDGSGVNAGCPTGRSGIYKDMTWQVADKNHNPINYSLPMYDDFNNNTPNTCGADAVGEGSAPGGTTSGVGREGHHYTVCSTACNNGGNCSVTGTQPYFINGFQINLSWTMSCTTITVASH